MEKKHERNNLSAELEMFLQENNVGMSIRELIISLGLFESSM